MAEEADAAPAAPDNYIVIGLDFGTTFTGVTWVHAREPEKLHLVNNWPNIETRSADKVATKLQYNDTGFVWGQTAVQSGGPSHSWFKLALEPERFRDAADTLGEALQFDNLDKLITDYLTGVFQHVIPELEHRLGRVLFDDSRFHIVVTVPAIWSDAAKQRTLRAVQAVPVFPAPFTASLFSEPEAAAIAALHDIKRIRNENALNVGDTFVIVDAGGGTVDLITYTITALTPRLEVREATEGTGGICGAALVDMRFRQYLIAKLGQDPDWNDETLQNALDSFEGRAKKAFCTADLTNNAAYNIIVPGINRNPELGLTRNSRLTLNATDVHMFFEPEILKIIRLVREQINLCNMPVQSILLVGGYGQSKYLRERLVMEFEQAQENPIEVLQPPNAWTAVTQGAAMRGLVTIKPENHNVPVVRARRARKHYGYLLGVVFNPAAHAELRDTRFWDDFDGLWRVPVMKWLLKRGELVSEDVPFRNGFFNTFRVAETQSRVFTLDIQMDEVTAEAPLQPNDNMRQLCRLTADLSAIPDAQMDQKQGADGQMWYNVAFEIEAVYHSASTQYCLIYKGVRYESVTAEYV
ncbi:hypothetical protein F5Y16DRAFT_412140 [Xylariaceae sp. FL0255]|nr:hypothetical protein F5Y16DRAFT_412140 [Xylariaceae sp. FL0255]